MFETGLYGEQGTAPIYYVDGFTRRHVPSMDALFAEFGPNAINMVQWLPAGAIWPDTKAKIAAAVVALVLVVAVLRLRKVI